MTIKRLLLDTFNTPAQIEVRSTGRPGAKVFRTNEKLLFILDSKEATHVVWVLDKERSEIGKDQYQGFFERPAKAADGMTHKRRVDAFFEVQDRWRTAKAVVDVEVVSTGTIAPKPVPKSTGHGRSASLETARELPGLGTLDTITLSSYENGKFVGKTQLTKTPSATSVNKIEWSVPAGGPTWKELVVSHKGRVWIEYLVKGYKTGETFVLVEPLPQTAFGGPGGGS